MPRRQAGYRYPFATTDARKHECAMCDVIIAIADRADTGKEPWGTPHEMPAMQVTEARAAEVRRQLFGGRNCKRARRLYGELSVSVTYLRPDGEMVNQPAVRLEQGYVLCVRVWSRDQAKREIARRVQAGEELSYNVLKK